MKADPEVDTEIQKYNKAARLPRRFPSPTAKKKSRSAIKAGQTAEFNQLKANA